MNKKRIIAIALTLILALSLAACGGGNIPPNASGGTYPTKPSATTPSATPSKDEDPCPCCPDCIQEECDCEECADSDDCKCTPGGLSNGPFTFKVEINTNFVGSLGQVYRTIGTATVTLNDSDSSGWFGSTEGHGEYTDFGPDYAEIVEYRDYDFGVKLSNYDPIKGDRITIGVDTFSAVDCFLMMSFEVHRTDLLNGELYTFELPMEKGIAKLEDHWVEPHPGQIVIDMTIIVTQVG